jgi:hypothetical protein
MKTYGGVDVWIHVFFTSALFVAEWPALRPLPLYPRGRNPGYPIVMEAGWAPRPVWMAWRREESRPYWDWNSEPSAVRLIAQSLYRLRCPVSHYVEYMNINLKLYLFPNIRPRSLKDIRRQSFVRENE